MRAGLSASAHPPRILAYISSFYMACPCSSQAKRCAFTTGVRPVLAWSNPRLPFHSPAMPSRLRTSRLVRRGRRFRNGGSRRGSLKTPSMLCCRHATDTCGSARKAGSRVSTACASRRSTIDDKDQLRENEVWGLAESEDGSALDRDIRRRHQPAEGRKVHGFHNGRRPDQRLRLEYCRRTRMAASGSEPTAVSADSGTVASSITAKRRAHRSSRSRIVQRRGRQSLDRHHSGRRIYRFADGRIVKEQYEGPNPVGEVWSWFGTARTPCGSPRWTGCSESKTAESTRYSTEDGLASNRMRGDHPRSPTAHSGLGSTDGLTTYHHGRFTSYNLGMARCVLRRQRDDDGSRRQHLGGIAHARLVQLWRGQFTSYTSREGLPAEYVVCGDRRQAGHSLDRHETVVLAAFREWPHPKSLRRNNGLPQRMISALAEDSRASVGGNRVGVFRSTQPIDCRRRRCDPKFVKVSDMYGRLLYPDRDGTMWIGANLDGLVAYRDGMITKYTMKNGLPSNAVRGMQQDRDGSLWLGTRGGGLAHFKDGTFTTYTPKRTASRPTVFSRSSWTATTRCGSAPGRA